MIWLLITWQILMFASAIVMLHPAVKPVFAWYDLWIGVFFDRRKRKVYIFLVPCLGMEVQLKPWNKPTGGFVDVKGLYRIIEELRKDKTIIHDEAFAAAEYGNATDFKLKTGDRTTEQLELLRDIERRKRNACTHDCKEHNCTCETL